MVKRKKTRIMVSKQQHSYRHKHQIVDFFVKHCLFEQAASVRVNVWVFALMIAA